VCSRVCVFTWWRITFAVIAIAAIIIGILGITNVIHLEKVSDIVLLCLGSFVIIAAVLNTVIRCNEPHKQKWFQGAETHQVELPEEYKRYRRNMGDEDSQGDVVVTSGSETEQSVAPPPRANIPHEETDTITVDVTSLLEQQSKTSPEKVSKSDDKTSKSEEKASKSEEKTSKSGEKSSKKAKEGELDGDSSPEDSPSDTESSNE